MSGRIRNSNRASAGVRLAHRRDPFPRCCRRARPTVSTPRMDPVPALGEHTDAILRELGYDASQIQALREAGTL
jgi:crotonobetainyl-CoA:carnitine CoA-transferase CaiB-like acyl-CoA transferase